MKENGLSLPANIDVMGFRSYLLLSFNKECKTSNCRIEDNSICIADKRKELNLTFNTLIDKEMPKKDVYHETMSNAPIDLYKGKNNLFLLLRDKDSSDLINGNNGLIRKFCKDIFDIREKTFEPSTSLQLSFLAYYNDVTKNLLDETDKSKTVTTVKKKVGTLKEAIETINKGFRRLNDLKTKMTGKEVHFDIGFHLKGECHFVIINQAENTVKDRVYTNLKKFLVKSNETPKNGVRVKEKAEIKLIKMLKHFFETDFFIHFLIVLNINGLIQGKHLIMRMMELRQIEMIKEEQRREQQALLESLQNKNTLLGKELKVMKVRKAEAPKLMEIPELHDPKNDNAINKIVERMKTHFSDELALIKKIKEVMETDPTDPQKANRSMLDMKKLAREEFLNTIKNETNLTEMEREYLNNFLELSKLNTDEEESGCFAKTPEKLSPIKQRSIEEPKKSVKFNLNQENKVINKSNFLKNQSVVSKPSSINHNISITAVPYKHKNIYEKSIRSQSQYSKKQNKAKINKSILVADFDSTYAVNVPENDFDSTYAVNVHDDDFDSESEANAPEDDLNEFATDMRRGISFQLSAKIKEKIKLRNNN